MTGQPRSALVVEDDDQICYILKFILGREGFVVDIARDGHAAEALIDKMQPPAIVTLDVMLPHADGFTLLKRIRARAGWEAVPVILLTARSQEKDVVRGLEAGANDYMVKPFKADELRARVRRLVKP
jgi:DNA-binding response OmpR family regulator